MLSIDLLQYNCTMCSLFSYFCYLYFIENVNLFYAGLVTSQRPMCIYLFPARSFSFLSYFTLKTVRTHCLMLAAFDILNTHCLLSLKVETFSSEEYYTTGLTFLFLFYIS